MKSLVIAFAASLALTGLALAQQPQIIPSQMAIQIDNAVNGMALSIEILQVQLKAAQDQVKQLQDKYEPKKPARRDRSHDRTL
jgi:phosphoribosylcarboxyaminoimidazole (NCAIR) mutase